MFNPKFIDVLKQRNMQHAEDLGQTEMLSGGLRHRAHPLPSMAYEPGTLATGIRGRAGDPSLMNGGSFGSFARSMGRGIRQVGRELAPVVQDIGRQVIPIVKQAGKDFAMQKIAQYGPQIAEGAAMLSGSRRRRRGRSSPCLDDGGKRYYHASAAIHSREFLKSHAKPRKTLSTSDGRYRRAQMVKQVMREHGMSMIQASSYIKQNGISY